MKDCIELPKENASELHIPQIGSVYTSSIDEGTFTVLKIGDIELDEYVLDAPFGKAVTLERNDGVIIEMKLKSFHRVYKLRG